MTRRSPLSAWPAPPSVTTALAEPETLSELRAVLHVRNNPKRGARPNEITASNVIEALRAIAAGRPFSPPLMISNIENCLGGLGLVQLHGRHRSVLPAGNALLAEAKRTGVTA